MYRFEISSEESEQVAGACEPARCGRQLIICTNSNVQIHSINIVIQLRSVRLKSCSQQACDLELHCLFASPINLASKEPRRLQKPCRCAHLVLQLYMIYADACKKCAHSLSLPKSAQIAELALRYSQSCVEINSLGAPCRVFS